jgi:hypothetical protein
MYHIIAAGINTNFTLVNNSIGNCRKNMIIGNEMITNRMVYKYLDALKNMKHSVALFKQSNY